MGTNWVPPTAVTLGSADISLMFWVVPTAQALPFKIMPAEP